jgi:hypothetical protein
MPETAIRDYLGRVLCSHCWNNCHYLYKRDQRGRATSIIIGSACEVRLPDDTPCECPCRARLEDIRAAEKRRRLARQGRMLSE